MFRRKAWPALILLWTTVFVVFAPPLHGEGEDAYVGLWDRAARSSFDDDPLLYRLASRYRARAVLRRSGELPENLRAREDSLGVSSEYLEDFIFLQDSLGLGWLPPANLKRREQRELVTRQVSVQLDSSRVLETYSAGGVPVRTPVWQDMGAYVDGMTRRAFRNLWVAEAERGIQLKDPNAKTSGGLISLNLPVEMPGAISSIVGKGAPNLTVSGSERISFSGTSRWYPDRPVTEFQRSQSKFPQLDMKQELNLLLTGSIGDKVSVDVDQSSEATTPLANRIKIHYKGYQDEVLQSVDLGNTSLSLPGTQYASYSGKVEGLFGINALAQVGDVEMRGILSKQEGKTDSRSLTRNAETRTFSIQDYQYVQGKFFFLTEPDGPPLSDLDVTSVEVWIDDRDGRNNLEQLTVPGYVTLSGNPQTVHEEANATGEWNRLLSGTDYVIQLDVYTGYPVLILDDGQILDPQMSKAIGVTYKTTGGRQIGGPVPGAPDSLVLKLIRPAEGMGGTNPRDLTQGVFADARKLELRNIYDLGSNLSPEGLSVAIRRKKTTGGVTNPDRIGDKTFLEILGLDLYTEVGENQAPGPDGQIDKARLDTQSGYVMFCELQPFAPLPIDEARCLADRPMELPAEYQVPGLYIRNDFTAVADTLSQYSFEVTARTSVSEIALNAFNLLQGSETVTAGGRTLQRDKDYTIDYDMGVVRILDAADVRDTDEIRVSYSYLPFGGGGQKTLAGSALSYKSQDNKLGFSTTWVYESKGAPGIEGRRPRLGQEPTRTVVGEFATSYKTPSWLIGSLVDGLPGVRTRDPGSIAIDAGMGVSLPNPNVRGELYVDDFEGAKDLNSISMNRTAWLPSAVPDSVPGLSQVEKVQRRGEAWWYSPRAAVKQGDLQPTLESRGGLADTEKDDNRSILELHFFPNGATEEERRRSWFSLVQPLSQRSTIDLSRAQFLDIWVNDFIPYERREERTGRLHLELGTVSEDAIWNRVRPEELGPNSFTLPNHELDTEDVNKDGQLDSPGSGTGEDVGLDNLPNAQEGSGDDPAYDDWAFQETQEEADRAEPSEDPGRTQRYARINGTEGNGRLDSEDLNGNLTLDQNQAYFHFVADLNDDKNPQPLVEFESSQAQDQDPKYAPYTRGWRRIRIPLTPTFYTKVGFPNWEQIKHVRIWVEGFRSEAYLQIGGIEITGNRWLKGGVRDSLGVALPDSSLFPGEDFFPAVLNNKDNSTSEYDPPFKPDERQDVEEREQSLTLEMRNFPPGHSGTVFRTFSAAQDFASLYRKLEFYVKRRLREEVPVDLDFFVRFARNADSDQDNYYEYRAPVTDGWVLHSVDMGMLSQLHLQADSNLVAFRDLGNGASISLKGNPSLTSVRRIAFGVISRGPSTIVSGNVWIDELRLASVKRDTGLASRFSMNLGLAGLGDMNFGFQRTDADFLKIGSDRGSGVTRSSLNTGARINVDRFLEGSGIVLPVSLNLAQTKDVPKFRTNSDLVLSGEARDENITETRSRDMQFSVSRSPSANPILKYTIDRISLSGNLSSNISNTPESRDTVMTRSGSISYALPLGGGPPIRVYRNTQLRLMPTNIQTILTGGWNKRIEYRRPDNDLDLPYEETRRLVTRNGTMNWSTGLRPIEAITYQFDQTRDLRLPTAPKRVFGLRLGTEVSRRHQLTASQAIPLFGKSLVPRVSWSGSFDGRFNSITSSGLGAQQRSNGFGNSNTLTLSGSLPIDRWMRALGGIARGGGGDGGGDAPAPAPGDSTGEAPPPPRAPRGGGSSGSSIFSLGAISTTYTIGKTDRSDRVSGEPSLSYQLGFSRDPGARVEKLNGFNSSQGNRRDLNLSTDLKLLSEIQVRTSYAYGFNKNSVNGAATTTRTRRFPDLDVNWGRLGQKLGLQALMKDLRASSRYTRETREVGTSANPKDRTETTVNLRPLLNLDATLKNGISAKLTSSYSSRESEQFGNVRSLTRDRSRQVGLTLRKTLSLTRVVTNPITKKQSRATSKLDLSLALDYQDNRLESGQGGNLVVTRDIAKYALSTTGSYNFTSSITGNAGLTLGQDSDKKNKTNTARYISITVSAAFNF